jgi:hypothetical protein
MAKHQHTVLEPLRFGGRRYMPGDPLIIDQDDAEQHRWGGRMITDGLIGREAVVLDAPPDNPPPVPPAQETPADALAPAPEPDPQPKRAKK